MLLATFLGWVNTARGVDDLQRHVSAASGGPLALDAGGADTRACVQRLADAPHGVARRIGDTMPFGFFDYSFTRTPFAIAVPLAGTESVMGLRQLERLAHRRPSVRTRYKR